MRLASLTHSVLLSSHRFADIRQIALGAMPMESVPLAQDCFHVGLGAGKVNGAFCLTFKAFDARLKFSHDVQNTFEISFGVFEAFEGIVTAGAVQTNASGFFKQAAAVISLEREGRVHKSLPEDGVGSFAQASLCEQFVHFTQADVLSVDEVFVASITVCQT